MLRFVVLIALLALFAPLPASAYLDPGSGSYFVQVVIATVLGSLLAIKLFFKNIKGYVSKLFRRGNHKNQARPDKQ